MFQLRPEWRIRHRSEEMAGTMAGRPGGPERNPTSLVQKERKREARWGCGQESEWARPVSHLRTLDFMLRPMRSHRRVLTWRTHDQTCAFKTTLAALWEMVVGETLHSNEGLPDSPSR